VKADHVPRMVIAKAHMAFGQVS